jgi:hypothetical protein
VSKSQQKTNTSLPVMLIKRKVVRGGRTWDVPYKYKAFQRNGGGKKSKRKKQKNRERTEKKKNTTQKARKIRNKGEENKSRRKNPSFPSNERFHQSSPKMLATVVQQ